MKKLITSILATAACLACFSGCNLLNKKPADPTYDVNGAKDYLDAMQKTMNVETRTDYELSESLVYSDQTYTIVWTVKVDGDAVKLVDGDGKVTVDVNENLDEAVVYTLTATITAPDNTTATVSFERTVKAAPAKVSMPITEAPQEGVEYKYHIWQSTKKIDCYFDGTMYNDYYGNTTEAFEEAVTVYVEYVQDSTELFNLYFYDAENNNAKKYMGVVVSGTHYNFKYDAAPVSQFKWDATLGTIVTEVAEGTSCYMGNYSTHATLSASTVDKASSAGSNVGHLVGLISKNDVKPALKVEQTIKEVALNSYVVGGGADVAVPTMGGTFADVKISWEVEGTNATVENGALKTTSPEVATNVTLKATFSVGETTDTKSYPITVVPNTTKGILDASYAIASGAYFANEATLTGVVTGFMNKGEWSEQYKNVSVYLAVYDGESVRQIGAYRLPCPTADDVKVGDQLTVTGIITSYNGAPQFTDCSSKAATLSQADLATIELAAVEFEEEYAATTEVAVPFSSQLISGATIEWASNNACAVVDGAFSMIIVTPASADQTVVITATLKANGATVATRTYTFIVKATSNAKSVSWTTADEGYENAATFTSKALDSVITLTGAQNSGSNPPKYYNTGTALRFYGKTSLTISAASGYTIKSIVITTDSYNNYANGLKAENCTLTNATMASENAEITITPVDGGQAVVLTNPNTSGHFRVQAITVVYEANA